MSEFKESLAAFERALCQAGVAVVDELRPGLDEAKIQEAFERLGLVPSDEVVEWFEWHDGAGDPVNDIRTCEIAPGVYFMKLELLCTEYLDMLRDFAYVASSLPPPLSDPAWLWSPTWFPLARLPAGSIAADLLGSPSKTSPVHAGWFDASDEYKAIPQWPSLDAFIRDLIRRYEAGLYTIDALGMVEGPDVDRDE